MTQGIAVKPASQVKTCSTCPYFDNFHEKNGRGWCNLFNHQAREHHEITNDCIISSDLAVSHELENNLKFFPEVEYEKSTDAFPTEELIDPINEPYSEYQIGRRRLMPSSRRLRRHGATAPAPRGGESFGLVARPRCVKIIDRGEDHTEWGVFKVIERRCNQSLYQNTETYLQQPQWYYRLSSNKDASAISKSLWVREDKICHFDESHLLCTEDIF